MIQALRNLVDLFTYYFDVLARLLDKLLDLLSECICQGELGRLMTPHAQVSLIRLVPQRTTHSPG